MQLRENQTHYSMWNSLSLKNFNKTTFMYLATRFVHIFFCGLRVGKHVLAEFFR